MGTRRLSGVYRTTKELHNNICEIYGDCQSPHNNCMVAIYQCVKALYQCCHLELATRWGSLEMSGWYANQNSVHGVPVAATGICIWGVGHAQLLLSVEYYFVLYAFASLCYTWVYVLVYSPTRVLVYNIWHSQVHCTMYLLSFEVGVLMCESRTLEYSGKSWLAS